MRGYCSCTALAVLTVAIAACAREDPGEPARFRIVGQVEPPPEGAFWGPVDIVASVDRIWVLDAGAAQVYGYDRDGAYRIELGSKGSGPGELKDPLSLGAIGDTLWILNSGNRRIEYYSTSGALLGSEPLPDSLPPPVDMIRLGEDWFLSTPFEPGPIIRLGANGESFLSFGTELENRALELSGGEAIPNAYRMEVVDGEIWAFHLYLPVVGIYDRHGGFLRLMSYPSPEVEAEDPVEEEVGEGRIRRLIRAPGISGGALGVLHIGRERFLLTRQRAEDRQKMYRLEGPRLSQRPTLAPAGTSLVTSVVSGNRTYAIGAAGDEEPTVFIVE